MVQHLEFEKPLLELEGKIAELEHLTTQGDVTFDPEIKRLKAKSKRILEGLYSTLTAQQKVQIARHPERPHFKDYIKNMIEDFTPLAGDRTFGEDQALIGGLGRFKGQSCVVIGHEKGWDMDSRITHNFGMANPEGYRKSQRLMAMAEKFQIPVITLVDTAGAYPGLGAEERGQSEAIAKSIESCLRLTVPLISVIIGEGGSGGAIAIAAANHVLMLEHSIYSIISPEGCASILWRSADYAKDAAEALKLTAQDLEELKIIDDIILEPLGGAHRNTAETYNSVGEHIQKSLDQLLPLSPQNLKQHRHAKFLEMGMNI